MLDSKITLILSITSVADAIIAGVSVFLAYRFDMTEDYALIDKLQLISK